MATDADLFIREQVEAAYHGAMHGPVADEDPWPYVLTAREAGVVVAALRAFADRPGGAGKLAERIYAEQQLHIGATLGRACGR